MTETGHISIHADNILPIIKKWLYSEKDIFLRELVSNASDALTKLAKLHLVGEVARELPEARIEVAIDKEKGTLAITDTGIGLTADEVKRYINQVAFSGLHDFVEKYKDKEDSAQIIGHFGLGFYSAFMVSSKVEIDSLSYKEGAQAVHWSCDGSTEFHLTPSDRKDIGTTITLHIAEDSKEMLEQTMIAGILHKYCAFMRFPVTLDQQVINETRPLWTRNPTELADSDYKEFFQKLFPFQPDPLFHVHLNVDYPFNLKGVLYFPKIDPSMDLTKGQVKLFCNQVYVDDNVKELIPEYMTLLKGVIDCPDLPLNVSRSYLQTDPNVRKISQHISKKIADKLIGMAKTSREEFEKFWDDIQPFVKFGMMRDDKFSERMLPHLIFKTHSGAFVTLEEYAEKMKGKLDDGVVLYSSDENAQAAYLDLLSEQGIEAIIAHPVIDAHFLPFLEMQGERKHKFQRVDAELSSHLLDVASESKIIDPTDQKTSRERLKDLFAKHLEKLDIRIEAFKSDKLPAMLLVDENMRRIKDMNRMGAFAEMVTNPFAGLEDKHTLVINEKNPAVQNVLNLAKSFNRDEELKLVVEQIYDLAILQQGTFSKEQMQKFVQRSAKILGSLGSTGAAAKTVDVGAVEKERGPVGAGVEV